MLSSRLWSILLCLFGASLSDSSRADDLALNSPRDSAGETAVGLVEESKVADSVTDQPVERNTPEWSLALGVAVAYRSSVYGGISDGFSPAPMIAAHYGPARLDGDGVALAFLLGDFFAIGPKVGFPASVEFEQKNRRSCCKGNSERYAGMKERKTDLPAGMAAALHLGPLQLLAEYLHGILGYSGGTAVFGGIIQAPIALSQATMKTRAILRLQGSLLTEMNMRYRFGVAFFNLQFSRLKRVGEVI